MPTTTLPRRPDTSPATKRTKPRGPSAWVISQRTPVHPQPPTKTGHWRTTPLKNLLHASRYGRASLGRRAWASVHMRQSGSVDHMPLWGLLERKGRVRLGLGGWGEGGRKIPAVKGLAYWEVVGARRATMCMLWHEMMHSLAEWRVRRSFAGLALLERTR